MDCKNIGLLMHQVLDEPEKMLKQREIIDSHCQQCPTCSSLWFELQQIENGLFEMDVVELPVDFSTIDWELLMQTETEMAESFSTSMVFPKLPNWVLVLITGVVILTLGVWGVLVLPGFWVTISQGLIVTQAIGLIKDIAYWVVLFSTFWEQSLLFILTNFIQVTVVIIACFAALIYLLKTRERFILN
ncbi:MAG: hypothetical protein APF76_03535 [Desulfitibacter sp. BRH_c19]|nr:MAG: hypothetical protein APF76_03535 [Desulfitibacter sp. BRH_c19]